MTKALAVMLLLALAGCSGVPQGQPTETPCTKDPGSYECQVDRYMRAP